MSNTIFIDVYSDTICPWCYIGKKKLQSALLEFSNFFFSVTWRPYQLNPKMPVEGMQREDYLINKFGSQSKANETYKLIKEAGENIGLYFQFEKIKKTPNSFASHKLLAFGYRKKKQNQIIESIFYSYFIEGRDIGNLDELINIAEQHNIDKTEIKKYLQSATDGESLLSEEKQARSIGIRGVPCFIINKKYVLFGAQDKEEFVNIFKKI